MKSGGTPLENREPMPPGRVAPDPPGGAQFPMCLYATCRTFYSRGDPHGGSGDETTHAGKSRQPEIEVSSSARHTVCNVWPVVQHLLSPEFAGYGTGRCGWDQYRCP